MTGGLEKFPKHKKNHSILQERSAIELQSIHVHYERLKTCPDRLHWCCVSSASTVLPPLVSFCREKKNHAPFLFILLKSGPTDDETFLPFSWSFMKTLPHFRSRIKCPLACVSLISWIRISRNENKRHDHFQKMSSTYHTECNTGGWGEAAPGCESLSDVVGVVFSHSHLHRRRIIINM